MLARREHSRRELTQKLTEKSFEKADIEELLNEFVALNWQSDQRFAESYSRSRLRSGYGPIRIQYELRERGIELEIDEVFEELPDWQVLLNDLHDKKYGPLAPKDIKERANGRVFFNIKVLHTT